MFILLRDIFKGDVIIIYYAIIVVKVCTYDTLLKIRCLVFVSSDIVKVLSESKLNVDDLTFIKGKWKLPENKSALFLVTQKFDDVYLKERFYKFFCYWSY